MTGDDLIPGARSPYPGAIGVKPGYTGDAGYCQAFAAIRFGHLIVGAVLNEPSWQVRITDMRNLLNWGFQQEAIPAAPSPSSLVVSDAGSVEFLDVERGGRLSMDGPDSCPQNPADRKYPLRECRSCWQVKRVHKRWLWDPKCGSRRNGDTPLGDQRFGKADAVKVRDALEGDRWIVARPRELSAGRRRPPADKRTSHECERISSPDRADLGRLATISCALSCDPSSAASAPRCTKVGRLFT